MSKKGTYDAEKARFWRKHLGSLQRSGLSKAEYCRRKGLSRGEMFYWQKKLASIDGAGQLPAPQISLVEVPLHRPSPLPEECNSAGPGPSGLSLVISDRFRIEISEGFCARTLARAVRVLEEIA